MATATTVKSPTSAEPSFALLRRVLSEGYGDGAWHGPDMKAALADVTAATAFVRPAPGRHNVAEIALHHAFYVRAVAAQLAGTDPERFPLEGEDWFEVADERRMSWEKIVELLERLQRKLASVVDDVASGRISSPLSPSECFDRVLGITCHANYHAGQIQLVKVLTARAS